MNDIAHWYLSLDQDFLLAVKAIAGLFLLTALVIINVLEE